MIFIGNSIELCSIWFILSTHSSFISTRVFNLNTQVERNEIEFEFNKVHLSFQPVYSIWIHKLKRIKLNLNSTRSKYWTSWMKKFHGVKFNLNEEISQSVIQLEWNNFIISFRYSTKVTKYQRFNEFPSTCSSFDFVEYNWTIEYQQLNLIVQIQL